LDLAWVMEWGLELGQVWEPMQGQEWVLGCALKLARE
jgi:hypothetical protein